MPNRSQQSSPYAQAELDLFTPQPPRLFVGWDRPLLDSAVDYLTTDWDESSPLDLSSQLLVVPTTHSGRRLREALAIRASQKNATAVIPPLVVTPEFFVSPERVSAGRFDRPVATPAETLIVWTSQLLNIDLKNFRHLFPVDPVERSLTWALKTAGDLLQVRKLLGETGLDFAAAARILNSGDMEPERWEELAELEKQAVKATRDAGMFDTAEARRVAAKEGRLPAEITKITILATPDPSPLAVATLERHFQKTPVEVVIFAPEKEFSTLFDSWGRPTPHEKWQRHHLVIPQARQTIFSERSPSEQADRATLLTTRHRDPGRSVAIGVPDPELVAPLEKALADHDIGGFDPGGKNLSAHSLYVLLGILNRLITTRSFDSFLALLRCPDANATIRSASSDADSTLSLTSILDGFDKLANDHLPETIDDARDALKRRNRPDREELQSALGWAEMWMKRFHNEAFGTVLTEFLGDVYDRRKFDRRKPDDAVFGTIADKINEILDAFDSSIMSAFSKRLDAAEHFDLLLEILKGQAFQPERELTDVDLQGWLELLWENAPHLILTGMNDGKVPEAIIGHAWLPDSARRVLGLRHNDGRYARDVYLLAAFLESRKATGGRVDFIFGRRSEGDDPLRPSRLLFQCPDDMLPGRIAQFFEGDDNDSENSNGPLPWHLSWQLKPPAPADDLRIFERLSVTSFRDFLECPFRFYLKHGLQMRAVEIQKTEMDSAEFGTLCHQVLQDFAEDPTVSKSTKVAEIREFFREAVDRVLSQKYGNSLTVPVLIQRRGMSQRLDWWAEIEAGQRQLGWEIIGSETEISPRDPASEEPAFKIGGLKITGSIDRIERHPDHGIRIVDFKTFAGYDGRNSLKSVEDYHITPLKRDESPADFPEWALVHHSSGKPARWSNLQLPLYKLAAEKQFPNTDITVAYGTIGKAKTEVTLTPWLELEAATLESARECANGVISKVLSRQFWPPAEKVRWDDFQSLFFSDILAAVDPVNLPVVATQEG